MALSTGSGGVSYRSGPVVWNKFSVFGASHMLHKTLSVKSFSIIYIQGKRALKKDAAKRKPSEVKSQIEVLTTASFLHLYLHIIFDLKSL